MQRIAVIQQEVAARTDLTEAEKLAQQLEVYDSLTYVDVDPDSVFPPMSADERAFAIVDGKLRWVPGVNYFAIRLASELQQSAQATGGLVLTGSSGTANMFFGLAQAMREVWGTGFDPTVLRMALLAWLLPFRTHGLHEVMRTAPLADRSLTYRDDWRR